MDNNTAANPLQVELLRLVFAQGLKPQAATAQMHCFDPQAKALDLIFALTVIASDLKSSFPPETHWTYTDWIEAAASLACDVYSATRLGMSDPTLAEVNRLWPDPDPHLTAQNAQQARARTQRGWKPKQD